MNTRLQGFALKQSVPVYASPSKKSSILKKYNYNQMLVYYPYSSDWYVATIYLEGISYRGYIYKDDVGSEKDSSSVRGVTISNTKVFKETSISSSVLKEYEKGSILKYCNYNAGWHLAAIYVNGKEEIGYIPSKDVETISGVQKPLSGVGIKSPTRAYSLASKKSKVLKEYKSGQLLKFRTFSSHWYEATIYVNGRHQTGYIYKDDVNEKMSENVNKVLKGRALENPTAVYSDMNRRSAVLKSYKKGKLLKYQSYNSNWLNATVYVKGKAKVGYINVNDVEDLSVKELGPNIPILMYHQIGNDPAPEKYGLYVTAENFKEQMNYLKREGYTPINFNEFHNIENIKKPVIITFDDGYENNMIAYKILCELKSNLFKPKATFFIIGSKVDAKRYLSSSQIKEMSDSEIISIQSHTMTHPFFNDNEIKKDIDYTEELQSSKKALEKIIGKEVYVLAYPYGSYNEIVMEETRKYYTYAVSTRPGIANIKDSSYELRRVRVRYDTTLEQFKNSIVKSSERTMGGQIIV